MSSFSDMLKESAQNVQLRKQLIRSGVPAKDVCKVVRTRTSSTVTDKQFMAGMDLATQFETDPGSLNELAQEYETMTGKKPPKNSVYIPSLVPLGGRAGHPRAWVPQTEARSTIKRRAEKANIPLRGRIEQEARPEPNAPPVKVAPDIVSREVRKLKRNDPDLASKASDRELVELVTDKHSLKS